MAAVLSAAADVEGVDLVAFVREIDPTLEQLHQASRRDPMKPTLALTAILSFREIVASNDGLASTTAQIATMLKAHPGATVMPLSGRPS